MRDFVSIWFRQRWIIDHDWISIGGFENQSKGEENTVMEEFHKTGRRIKMERAGSYGKAFASMPAGTLFFSRKSWAQTCFRIHRFVLPLAR